MSLTFSPKDISSNLKPFDWGSLYRQWMKCVVWSIGKTSVKKVSVSYIFRFSTYF